MGQEIITGYTGTRHITPGMDAAVWRGVFGTDSCIVETGNNCAGSMPDVNTFIIRDGVVSIQGYLGYGTPETLTVDTCATGFKRIDLVCARYAHDLGSLIDSIEYVLIKGAEVASPNIPTPPAYNQGIIADGANLVDFPLYRINLDGGNVTFEQLAEIASMDAYTKAEADDRFVKVTGDTMTGNLQIESNNIPEHSLKNIERSADAGVDIPPAGTGYFFGREIRRDKNNQSVFTAQTIKNSNDELYTSYGIERRVDGVTKEHRFYLNIMPDGTQSVTFATGSMNAWKKGLDIKDKYPEYGQLLFENASTTLAAGASANITLLPATTPAADDSFLSVRHLAASGSAYCYINAFAVNSNLSSATVTVRNAGTSSATIRTYMYVFTKRMKTEKQYT